MNAPRYIGRFAPSPTGPVHFGTLIAAVASYLRAKECNGQWMVRIEDVDVFRKVEQADVRILRTLQAFGFEWDGEPVYQSSRTQAYEQALLQLRQQGLVYPCTCSRKQLARQTGQWSPVYPGTCRDKTGWDIDAYAVRLKTPDELVSFNDVVFGEQHQNLAAEVGDFVIKRRDGVFAYQLAVVVDDAWQQVTEVVRGTDLMDSTARQIYLQRCLGLPTPAYLHFPVAVDAAGNKLSKSVQSMPVDDSNPLPLLNAALQFLGQPAVDADNVSDFWQGAIANWDAAAIPVQRELGV